MDIGIRPWRSEDAADLAAALNNPKILANLRDGLPFPYTEDDARFYITAMLSADPDSTYAFAITVDDRAIGSIGAFRKDNIHRQTAEIGYYIAEPYWGQGITTTAVRALCRYLQEHTDIVRIFAEPFAHNSGSCRVLEKSGFQFEGVMRKNAFKNGEFLDMRLYALVKE